MPHLYQRLLGSLLLLFALWSSVDAAATAINLGTATRLTVLGGGGITAGAGVRLFGDVAVTPAFSATLVGFSPARVLLTDYALSPLVSGKLYAPDYTLLPATLNQASTDSIAAFRSGSFQSPPDFTTGGDLGGRTLTPGLYYFNAAVTWSTDVTLQGGCADVFVFQVGGALGCAAGAKIILTGGVQANNIFWVVNGAITTGADSVLHGIFLTNAAATIAVGNTVYGRILAQTAITIAATVNVYPPTSVTCAPLVTTASSLVSTILAPVTSTLTRLSTTTTTLLSASTSTVTLPVVSTTLLATTTLQLPASTVILTSVVPTTFTTILDGVRTTIVSLVPKTATG
uniref:Antifreeze protein n=1 Tax=Glaciozyma antarctica TaxID=105987 RepID=M1K5F6_9BASI|nr:antifreeze protein [Glaciozyma antarctica]